MTDAKAQHRFLRVDATRCDRVRELPGGQYVIDGTVGVVGVLEYAPGEVAPDARREYVPAEVLFEPASLESLRGAPVVVGGHPALGVGPDSDAPVAGAVASVQPDPSTGELQAEIRFWRADAAETARAGTVELSLGYEAEFVPGPGVAPDGQPYDGVQRSRRYNHLAQVDQARAGRRARLRLDGASRPMIKLTHAGTTHEVPEYIAGACRHHAIDPDTDTRADMETASVSIEMEGETTDLVLPKSMVDRWLSDLGALGGPPPEAPEVMEEEIVEDMAAEAEEEKVEMRADAIDAAIERALARRDAAARELRDAERQCRPYLPASYDYDAVTDPHQLRADAIAATDERRAAKARDLADKARKGDLRAAGRLDEMIEGLTARTDSAPDEGVTTTHQGTTDRPFTALAWGRA